ncbi:glycosyltransferase [Octadecabacter sp.]|nr:glycosyltransferase [Octadecabacter sp.]
MQTFSVLVPHYKQLHLLERLLRNLSIAEGASKATLIIVDDGSNSEKDFLAITDQWENTFFKIKSIILPHNVGVSKALNVGLESVRTKYFFRVDVDDEIESNRFRRQLFMMENENADLCFSNASIYFKQKKICESNIPPLALIRYAIHYKNYLIHPTVCIRTSYMLARGGYCEKERSGQDWRFWKTNFLTSKIVFERDTLTRLHIMSNSVSNKRFNIDDKNANKFIIRTALKYFDRRSAFRHSITSKLYSHIIFCVVNPYRLILITQTLRRLIYETASWLWQTKHRGL